MQCVTEIKGITFGQLFTKNNELRELHIVISIKNHDNNNQLL